MNPIQQAIEALEMASRWTSAGSWRPHCEAALTSLRSLQKEAEGVELPKADFFLDGGSTPCWYESSVRTAVAAALGRGAGQADDAEIMKVLKERDDSDDFIDAVLDEVLGADRPEWSSAYGRADALDQVRESMSSLQKPIVDRAWDRFEKAMVAPEATQPTQAEAPSEPVAWRDLALQFDGHRMQALGWLKLIVRELPQTPAWVGLRHFLASPPLSGEAVLAERIAALAAQQAGQGEPVAVAHKGRHVGSAGVHISRLAALDELPDGVHKLYTATPPAPGQVEHPAIAALRKIKIRLAFMNWPAESMWNAGTDEKPHWIPDWRYECQLIENVLHGTPITTSEKPTDTAPFNQLPKAPGQVERDGSKLLAEEPTWDMILAGWDYAGSDNNARATWIAMHRAARSSEGGAA